jgi:hypothetical protein
MYSEYLPIYDSRKIKNSAFAVKIFGSHSGLDYNIQIRVNKNAVVPPNTDNLVLHLALTESEIPFNWQGQTQVDYAERLMAPNENGTVLNFASGDEQIIDLNFTLSSAWVLENLELVSFIQNLYDKEILQGTKVKLTDIVPLPVELISFSAVPSANGITLNWITASEINNQGFEVEKSNNGINFYVIGFVPGAGTTTNVQKYIFTDETNQTNLALYYRLKQIDFNGSFTYSNVINVNYNLPSEFSLSQNYPNPFNPETNIKYSVAKREFVSIKVYDISGQEIASLINEVKDQGSYNIKFNGSSLASGIYFVRMNAGNFSSIVKMNILK